MTTLHSKNQRKNERRRLQTLLVDLKRLESSLAKETSSEQRSELSRKDIASRAKNAAMSLKSRITSDREVRNIEKEKHPERKLFAKLLTTEAKFFMRNLELSELEQKCSMAAKIGAKFQSLLPNGVASRMQNMMSSPGNIVVALTELEAENQKNARKYLCLQGQEIKISNAIETAKIANSNANSLAELSNFEEQILKSPHNSQAKTETKSGFGIKYYNELAREQQKTKSYFADLAQELKKFRNMTVSFVNSHEKKHVQDKQFLEECEILAAKYLRNNGGN